MVIAFTETIIPLPWDNVTPLPMLSPLISTHSLQQCTYAVTGVLNVMTHLAYDHIIGSFFIHSYIKTKIIGSMQGHLDQYPKTQLVKNSHSTVAAHSSLVINVFSKLFSSRHFHTASNAYDFFLYL